MARGRDQGQVPEGGLGICQVSVSHMSQRRELIWIFLSIMSRYGAEGTKEAGSYKKSEVKHRNTESDSYMTQINLYLSISTVFLYTSKNKKKSNTLGKRNFEGRLFIGASECIESL